MHANARVDAYGWPPLPYAAFCGSLEALQLLVQNGADVDAVSCSASESALNAAAGGVGVGGSEEVVKLLLSRGADVNARYPKKPKYSALAHAAGNGHLQVMEVLIVRGADVNALVSLGHGLLSCRAECGEVEAVKLLLRKGAGRDSEQLIEAARHR